MLGEQPHRERFDGHELAMVLSHYDLGVIEQLRAFPRGSRRSPKVRIRSRTGEFLLKRRAPGQDDPYRVAFAHDVQLHLERRGYPVAGFIGTRDDNNSMLQLNGRAYEMFKFIAGERPEPNEVAARTAGEALGRMHRLLGGYRPAYTPRPSSFHGSAEIDAQMALIVPSVCALEPHVDRPALNAGVDYLRLSYHDAARRVDDAGFRTWPVSVIHGDWHPGNLLCRDGQVAGVVDFDSSRLEQLAAELANACLQFAMQRTMAADPARGPDGLDLAAIRGILHGYHQGCGAASSRSTADDPGPAISTPELAAVPWLMIEALIVEGIVPIAATGSFARIAGSVFLQMIQRKVKWIRPRAARMMEFAKEGIR